MVQWEGTNFLNYSHYGFNFGLKGILTLKSFEAEHRIVVPVNEWDKNPYMKCDYDSSEMTKIKPPWCKDCKGTGIIILLKSTVSCGCMEK
jgi:hypothetical protein